MRTFRFVELANEVNEHMPDYAQSRITSLLNEQRKSLSGSKVLLLGLAYKKGSSDWRESPSVAVADQLAESGARIEFCDPRPEVNARNALFPPRRIQPREPRCSRRGKGARHDERYERMGFRRRSPLILSRLPT
jgi:UDP-glucose 6-dehydrogenase